MSQLPRAWLFDFSSLDHDVAEQLLPHLSDKEIERANAFKHAQRRLSFIASRALAYNALKKIFPLGADDWIIASEGEPLISSCINSTDLPRISLSHSGNLALCAIGDHNCLIGCDIETHKPRVNMLAIAKQFFTDNEYRILDETKKNHTSDVLNALFLKMWTCKEAWLKAQGFGIANGLKKISIGRKGFSLNNNDEIDWQLHNLESNAYSIAMAIKQNNSSPSANKAFIESLAWNSQTGQFDVTRSECLTVLTQGTLA